MIHKKFLLIFCLIVFASLGLVSAAGNTSYVTVGSPASYSYSSSNVTTSVLLNVTFQVNGGAGAGDIIETANISGGTTGNASVQFIGYSSNATRVNLGTTQTCAYGRNITEFACWMTVTLNASMDAIWTVTANISNSSDYSEGVNGTLNLVGSNASANATNVLFDSTPPRVTFLVNEVGTNLAGVNYSGVLINVNVSINDTKMGGYKFSNTANTNDSVGILKGTIRLNISTGGTQNVTYIMNNVTETNGTAIMFNFTINTSHLGATPATYTFAILANDTLNNMNNSESFSFVLDQNNPAITAVKLANSTQTALYLQLTVGNTLSGLNGVCTTDRTGDDVSGNPLLTGDKAIYVSESSLSCGTTYSYVTTCTDYAGNVGTSTLSFATNNCQGSAAGGGGGGSNWTWTKTYVEDRVELSAEGVTKQLSSTQRVKVKIGFGTHHVGIILISGNTATIEISSEPVTVKLQPGQEAKVDVDNDNTYDVLVLLNAITDGQADVSVKRITEDVPEGAGPVSTTGEDVTGQEPGAGGEQPTTPEKEGGSLTWLWVLVIVIIIVVVVVVIQQKKK